ncbi:MAG: exonuclease SbcCD subunit D, partial [Pauljensenia sp.]
MLILHTSDWHLGRTLHGAPLGDSADAFIDWLVALVGERRVDAVLISGDVFDRAVPPVDALARMRWALRKLTAITTVILTSGNHDGAARLGLFADMLSPSLHVVTDPEAIGSAVEAGGALVYPMPYLEPDLVRQALSDLETDGESGAAPPLPRSHQAVMAAALRRVRQDLSARREAGDQRPAIAMPHAFVTGANPSDSERDIQVGGVPSVSADLFDTLGGEAPLAHGLDYVAAGHLHRPQDVAGASVPIR